MGNNLKARRVVKASDALRVAEQKFAKDGTPVPQELREELDKAVKDYRRSKEGK